MLTVESWGLLECFIICYDKMLHYMDCCIRKLTVILEYFNCLLTMYDITIRYFLRYFAPCIPIIVALSTPTRSHVTTIS